MTVIDLAQKRLENSPHESGTAVCRSCYHEWQFVCPFPSPTTFDCPECKLTTGVKAGLYSPDSETLIFQCNCGNDRMIILSAGGFFCEMCGVTHEDDR